MVVSEYDKTHMHNCLDKARGCAMATIANIYERYEHRDGLSDVDIDKVKDSLQILMYVKSLE